ncbi:hypothetical protein [Leptospira meyeri]|uniref:hypothetical protein n=1 Tax=Leptospira meyeri TaxID=29508 RepID=UPI0002C01C19|nr:hypothetical protein [Leptospira meyeri]EMJ85851.1 hypothetical protein LEP1GSC196_0307 [Leptospira meyeri serovar Semaranga str. Veldrot Semarang 173]
MRFRLFFIVVLIFFNHLSCKKEEIVIENVQSFYINNSEGCLDNIGSLEIKQATCITDEVKLDCYLMLQNLQSSKIVDIFKNKKWTSPDFNEHTFNYYFDNNVNFKIIAGGPSESKADYESIGKGRIYRDGKSWTYEQICDKEKCERMNFAIEYVNCAIRYYKDSEEHRLFLTIGNRYYDQYDDPNKRKFLSIVLEEPVKPQFENGFELYLVPPPPK